MFLVNFKIREKVVKQLFRTFIERNSLCRTVTNWHNKTAQSVKEKLASVGITTFPDRIENPIWNEIKTAVDPPLTIQELIELKNDLFPSPVSDESAKTHRKRFKPKLICVNTFSKRVCECQNNFIFASDDHKFVDLDRVVEECLSIVYSQLPEETTHFNRIPPLVLMRLARGGKTKTLAKLFDRLKEDGRANPILISLNGNGPNGFQPRVGETQTQAILRLIAMQLVDYTPEQALNLVVDRKALDDHLGDNNVVLLLDELNNLGVPLDCDAAQLLRELFLDRPGRFLVFTSHFPVSIEKVTASNAGLRGISTVNMSLARTLVELRGMSKECDALTEERAAWYGYIPSLIYVTTGKYGIVTPSNRFRQMNIAIEHGHEFDVLKRFVKELLSGYRDPMVTRYYGAFASVDANSLVSYPLCYVKEIFEQLCIDEAVTVLLRILNKLERHLDSNNNNGLAWECTVKVAIILRMLEARWSGSQGPFELVPAGTKPDLDFRTLPDECDTLEDAKDRIETMITEYTSPTLIYVMSDNDDRYPEVEGFMVYTSGHSTRSKIVGFQMKSDDVKPRNHLDTKVIDGGAVLIRGPALDKKSREPKDGWRYMTSESVRDFIGKSLQLAMPREWLRDSSGI